MPSASKYADILIELKYITFVRTMKVDFRQVFTQRRAQYTLNMNAVIY
jgi:hypothetical protein